MISIFLSAKFHFLFQKEVVDPYILLLIYVLIEKLLIYWHLFGAQWLYIHFWIFI